MTITQYENFFMILIFFTGQHSENRHLSLPNQTFPRLPDCIAYLDIKEKGMLLFPLLYVIVYQENE